LPAHPTPVLSRPRVPFLSDPAPHRMPTPSPLPPESRRPSSVRRVALLVAVALGCALAAREIGGLNFHLSVGKTFRHRGTSVFNVTPTPLSADDRQRLPTWQSIALPDRPELKIYFTETRVDPWTRWMPLVKIGRTRIERPFLVVRGETRLLTGKVAWRIDQRVYGSLSAREFVRRATPSQPKEFLEALRHELQITPAVAARE
jgi:hypothetical protein